MKVMNETNGLDTGGVNPNTRISARISRCEKGIYDADNMKSKPEVNQLERPCNHNVIGNLTPVREIGLDDILSRRQDQPDKELMSDNLQFKNFRPVDFLNSIEPYVHEGAISTKNYTKIKDVANYFTGGLTSFFGFESRLSDPEHCTDYLFAISSKRGERETLADLFQKEILPENFLEQPEWQKVEKFTVAWSDPRSILYDNVLGLWFEFDVAKESSDVLAPNIFLHTVPLYIDNPQDIQKCKWLTRNALSLLIGQPLPEKLEQNVMNCIQKLPKGASLFSIGLMLSRSTSGIRLVVKRIKPKQIVSYLKAIGFAYDTKEIALLIEELEKMVTRIVLSFDVTDDGIGPKIGVECGFNPKHHDQYQPEPRWSEFLDYLVKKELCLPEKRDALLSFLPNTEDDENSNEQWQEPLVISTKITGNEFTNVLVRQMGHIKIVYKPNHPLEAKAYFGARLFGITRDSAQQPSVMRV